MIGVVVAAHGALADALVDTARLVVPTIGKVAAVGITDTDDSARYEKRLRQAVEQVSGGGGVLLLTDMFGGTPSNLGLTLHDYGNVEVLTGTNLPMLIKALQLSGRSVSLQDAASEIRRYGQRSIAVAGEVLAGGVKATEGEAES